MTETLIDNASEIQNEQQQQQDAVVLSNGTILVASAEAEGGSEVAEQAGDQAPTTKGDLTRITSPEDGKAVVVEENHNIEAAVLSITTQSETVTGDDTTNMAQATDTKIEPGPIASSTSTTIAEPSSSDPHPTLSDPVIRAITPSSRTSTPPLGSSAVAKKKFSSVNVNQRFLSKAGSPSPTVGPAKVSSLNSSPVPIVSTSSRLLSTKLTTVPSSKSSTSPSLSGPAPASSSPWAKPVLPPPTEPTSPAITNATLHQPAPMRARVLGSTTTPPVMGASLGIAAPPKPAWKAVAGEQKKSGLGISRDFPTTKEVADGMKAAQMAAQAQAAHNQAILQGLNAFTQLDPNSHRWDEEDEEDDVIDFGDGLGDHHETRDHIDPANRAALEQSVAKTDRFAEDFDRSWPRRQPAPIEREPVDYASRRSNDADNGRVLFNASNNRLEPPRYNQQTQPIIQPTRLMSRPSDVGPRQPLPHVHATGRGPLDRPLPPHLQGGANDDRRSLPPHMAATGGGAHSQPRPPPGPTATQAPTRSAWGSNRETDRAPPPHITERRELPPQSSHFEHSRSPEKSQNSLPARRYSQTAPAPPTQATHPLPEPIVSNAVGVDSQSAEMHSAAEKAKLRRLAEEAEREAAAERARRKAKELEERFKGTSATADNNTQQPPGLQITSPQITLVTRPKIHEEETAAPRSVETSALPPRPNHIHQQAQVPHRNTDSSWRDRLQPAGESHPPVSMADPTPSESQARPSRSTAESFFESQPGEPPKVSLSGLHDATHPKQEANFDSMLARIQAAMAQARAVPPPGLADDLEIENIDLPEAVSYDGPREVPAIKSAQPKAATSVGQEYFDVSYPEPPKSPPPAWRTYTIRLPKAHPTRSPVPRARLRALEAPRLAAPPGFATTFVSPSDNATSSTLSRAELLLPQPVLRRFQRAEPIVSISPRTLEPYEKKGKKKTTVVEPVVRADEIVPARSVETSLPSASTLRSQQLRDQRNRADDWRQAESSVTVTDKPQPPMDDSIEIPPRKVKSPVKASAAAKAEREGRFVTDGVTIGAPERDRMPMTDKPGVRFMVSSELEGDSLLDEVNKMSLETLGDGDEKEREGQVGEPSKIVGAETPKTPPVPRPTSPNTSTWPKVPLSYPASHSPARSVTQHDHDAIKSVWDAQQMAVKQTAETGAPMYPSLNAPSSVDHSSAAQPLPGSMKMSFSHSQTFSSPGAAGPSLAAPNPYANAHRAPSAHTPYGQFGSPQSMPSPDVQPHNMMGLNYSSTTSNPRVGANGFQQGVWSPTAFGTSMASPGYAYASQKPSMDPKSPASMGYVNNGKTADISAYGGYPTTYQQQQQYAAPGYGRGANNNHPNPYAYGYGAPGQQARPATGRFAQANGEYATQAQGGQYGMTEGGQGGYYGGVAQGMYPATAYQQGHGAVGQGGRGTGAARKMW